ncbi:MAG: guanylate kinase [Desulfobulbaceae bacterium]|nr:guanylate kinase [Desulfobulbaceae bacterium]
MSQGHLFVISAPSGAGKTTILKPILAQIPAIGFSVSHTTRQPRPGEIDGKDYYFVSVEQFLDLREEGDFLEWAEVHGNFYGTSQQAVMGALAQGRDVILDIDVQGADQLRSRHDLTPTFIFIAPPSLAELERRLTDRQTETEATITLRLQNAQKEFQAAARYNYTIVNDNLEHAKAMLTAIILEKRAASRRGYDGKQLIPIL